MKKKEAVPGVPRRKSSRWLHLGLGALIGLALGIGQGVAAPASTSVMPAKPTVGAPAQQLPAKPTKPIQTKSGRKAALKEATQAILQAEPVTGLGAPVSRLAAPVTTLGLPVNATDETAVPHYFGPWPNWALSPLTLPDATVTIDPPSTNPTATCTDIPTPAGCATATATVGTGGVVTGITITNPGSGYTANPSVEISGSGTNATAGATYTPSGSVTAIDVTFGGAGYTEPVITIAPPRLGRLPRPPRSAASTSLMSSTAAAATPTPPSISTSRIRRTGCRPSVMPCVTITTTAPAPILV